MRSTTNGYPILAVVLALGASIVAAEDKPDYVPKPGEFPPPDSGHYFAGELVMVDPINRRGGIRLDGDEIENKYDKADPLLFAMLPYGALWHHGAPAELCDIPIGTHVHGYFFLPPEGDKSIPPPKGHRPDYVPKQNHAILLEDDFSFYQRRGRGWKVESVDRDAGKLHLVSTGPAEGDGLTGKKTLEIDRSTRVWRGRELAEWEAIATGQDVQVSLTWAPNWVARQFHCADIWLDQESRDRATERQRQLHLRYQRNHWLAGWVDHVEHEGLSRGAVTLTLFGGMDPTLYDEVRAKAKSTAFAVAVGENTLRTYNHSDDARRGPVLEIKENENPPLGSSGIQLRIQMGMLLEGYRPGRIVRVCPNDWPRVKLPPEQRVTSRLDP